MCGSIHRRRRRRGGGRWSTRRPSARWWFLLEYGAVVALALDHRRSSITSPPMAQPEAELLSCRSACSVRPSTRSRMPRAATIASADFLGGKVNPGRILIHWHGDVLLPVSGRLHGAAERDLFPRLDRGLLYFRAHGPVSASPAADARDGLCEPPASLPPRGFSSSGPRPGSARSWRAISRRSSASRSPAAAVPLLPGPLSEGGSKRPPRSSKAS